MLKEVRVPDIGAFSDVEIIEVSVVKGSLLALEAALITLETDKATLEIPSPEEGVVQELYVKVGDKVSEGHLILTVEVADSSELSSVSDRAVSELPVAPSETGSHAPLSKAIAAEIPVTVDSALVHASPKVRRFARELGVDITNIQGTGPKNRILETDVQSYVKQALLQSSVSGVATKSDVLGSTLPPWPTLDHAKFGPIQVEPLSRIQKRSAAYLHRNWISVPHVTQFDEADITELEEFRKAEQPTAERADVKLTPLVFIMKAVVATLKAFKRFNASLDATGQNLTIKQYFHIGVAVDTPNGLVVPVIRDVDQKGLLQLAQELGEMSQKARKGQLTAEDMQGSSFSISSLGGIGGTGFTPIVNVPDVAILGVSKAVIKPVFLEGEFKARRLLPVSLSFDHRVIDGAEAARFTAFLVKQLSDIRCLLL